MMRIRLGDWVAKSFFFRRRRGQSARRRPLGASFYAEVLEPRVLLAAPVANNDSYSVIHDHTLGPGTPVTQNDSDLDFDPLTASLVAGPGHAASFTLNSNGTFSYSPSALYVGADSFTYKDWDGTSFSNTATVSLSVTNATPTAAGNSYTIYKDTFNSTTEGAVAVLGNDLDTDGDALTASLNTGVASGTLTLNSNGSFVYTPTAGFFGVDSFTYKAFDGISYSAAATVALTVTSPFSAQTNASDAPVGTLDVDGFATSALTGETRIGVDLGHGHSLAYNSLAADARPVIAVETTWNGVASAPSSIEARLTFNGVNGSTIYYQGAGVTGSDQLRFTLQANATGLATGRYAWTVTLVARYGANQSTRTFTGSYDLVNRSASEFGPGWTLSELDRLHSGTGGMLFAGGTGVAAWFTDTGSGTYSSPAGPLAFHTLVKNGNNTYTLTDKFGNKENFSTIGLLTTRVDVNGNTTTYAYTDANSDGQTVELSTITDPFSRVATFNYTSGKVSSVVDIAGRTTTLGRDGSSRIATITQPDPDGAGALAAPVTTFAYDTSNRMTSVTDPLSHATQFEYFSFSGRLKKGTFADTNTQQFQPAQTQGLVDTSTGSGTLMFPAALYKLGFSNGTQTNELGQQTLRRTDRFGFLTLNTDPLGFVTTYTRDANGLPTQFTTPDPDGGGSLTASVTGYQYDSKGNLTRITYADSSYETWTWHSTLNVPLTHVDLRGKTTTYTVDSKGNRLTATDPLGHVTTYAYNSSGQVTSVTAPDPDGVGSASSPVTTFTYDTTAGRLTRITNPDSTHRDFTYNTSDTLATSADELGRTTTYAYDALDRPTSVTGADPDGAGALTSPVTSFVYNVGSLVTSQTDPLGKVTSFAYDTRDRPTTLTQPDPDGAGR